MLEFLQGYGEEFPTPHWKYCKKIVDRTKPQQTYIRVREGGADFFFDLSTEKARRYFAVTVVSTTRTICIFLLTDGSQIVQPLVHQLISANIIPLPWSAFQES